MISVESGEQFHLKNDSFSYICGVVDRRFLAHLYWGAPVREIDPRGLPRPATASYLTRIPLSMEGAGVSGSGDRGEGYPEAGGDRGGRAPLSADALAAPEAPQPPAVSLDLLPQEYPAWGTGEQREGAFAVVYADGSEASRLEYREFEVIPDAAEPEFLGLLRQEHELGRVETLRIRLADPRGDISVDLYYLIAERAPVLIRWARFINTSEAALTLIDPASASVDLPVGPWEVLTLGGAWSRERHILRTPLAFGGYSVGSRGGATGHQSAPFLALCDPAADEEHGRVYAVLLAYSGSFEARCEVDQFEVPRLSIGLQRYRGHLEAGECFETPVALLVSSRSGFGGMSDDLHRFLREGVIPKRWREAPPKVVINSWEAMYFQVSHDRTLSLARGGRDIGAELLVLDDGWFSRRRDDRSSLGDWWPNEERFPLGLAGLADALREEGMEFGFWMEPEMVSPESDLCREHPEWVLQIPGREPTLARSQLILDLTREEVREYLIDTVSTLLRDSGASYLKWDMNRNMSEAGSLNLSRERQGEVMHRYILGLYEILRRLTEAFPGVLIEGCAGGGGRMDYGLLRYCPRFWASDQTDAIERLEINYGTTLLFPPEVIGSHVSTVPNHQVRRITDAETRVLTSLPFSFGFELDPAQESEEERLRYLEGARRFRELRQRFSSCRFRRLLGPLSPESRGRRLSGEPAGEVAWMLDGGDEVFIFYYRPLTRSNVRPRRLRIPGLTAGAIYQEQETGIRYDGALLGQVGIVVEPGPGDYRSTFVTLIRTGADRP